MIEQIGQKAWLLPTANNVSTYISAGTTTRDKAFIAEHPTLVTEGVFITLTELATRDASHAAEIERLKNGLRGLILDLPKHANDTVWVGNCETLLDRVATILEYNEKQTELLLEEMDTPDTAAHDADTRNAVLEEVTEAVIPKGCHAQGCPLTKAQRTAKTLLAQDKE